VTEQGEVINAKYANPVIGRRNLETFSWPPRGGHTAYGPTGSRPEFLEAAASLSVSSMAAYRKLVYETDGSRTTSLPNADRRDCRAQYRFAPRREKRIAASRTCVRSLGFSWGQSRVTLPGLDSASAPAFEACRHDRDSWL